LEDAGVARPRLRFRDFAGSVRGNPLTLLPTPQAPDHHPKAVLVFDGRRLKMPAFGAYTGVGYAQSGYSGPIPARRARSPAGQQQAIHFHHRSGKASAVDDSMTMAALEISRRKRGPLAIEENILCGNLIVSNSR
jgi:hypothetical protein